MLYMKYFPNPKKIVDHLKENLENSFRNEFFGRFSEKIYQLEESLDKKEYKNLIKEIGKWIKGKGKLPTILIENSPGDFTFIFDKRNIQETPLPELSEDEKKTIEDFIEKNK